MQNCILKKLNQSDDNDNDDDHDDDNDNTDLKNPCEFRQGLDDIHIKITRNTSCTY